MAKSYQPTEEDILRTMCPSHSFLASTMKEYSITSLTAHRLGYEGAIMAREKDRTRKLLYSLQRKGLVDRKHKWTKKWFLTEEGREVAENLD